MGRKIRAGHIVYYRKEKNQNLLPPMLHGDKELDFAAEPSRDDWRARLLALGLFALCVSGVMALLARIG